MSVSSLTGSFSMGMQSAKGTAATAFKTALSTMSKANVKFDEREPPLEHPSIAARATNRKTNILRTGYMVAVGNEFQLHPRFFGTALRAAGFGVVSVNNTTFYTHTFTIADRSQFGWATVLDKMVGTTTLERKIVDVRLDTVSITADTKEIKGATSGIGLSEGNASGSETKVAEVADELNPASGSATIVIAGTTITSPLRGLSMEIKNEFDQEDKQLFSALRADLPQLGMDITGTLSGIDVDFATYEVYRLITRNTLVATAPSLIQASGALSYIYQSSANIPTAAVPYSLSVAFGEVDYTLQDFQKSGKDLVRADVNFAMVDKVTTPLTIILVNDQATYP
jgi:hypothetical protein